MPELPEAETIRRQLLRSVRGAVITETRVLHRRMTRNQPRRPSLRALTEGRRITDVGRHGKMVTLTLDPPATLLIRLGMSGQVLVCRDDAPPGDHTRVRFRLRGGEELRLDDMRMFGGVQAFPSADPAAIPPLAALGPDALGLDFTREHLAATLRKRTAPLIALLMNQSLVAGLGNIYANEACFAAGVHPLRRGGDLRRPDHAALHNAVRRVLAEAVRLRGTSMRDGLYRDLDGAPGDYQRRLRVYAREGEPCLRCRTPITRARHQGRSVFFCAKCQR